ncbi:MAG: PhnD/SsuA/transferrin family substrate-binding protein, partial [Desulfobacteraceae bacterium]|nr:PhnD/SsuA/transferrin family substrate-binding protein [Desulfobacteraceae bacterium]
QSIWGEQQAKTMWQPTIDYLNQQRLNYQFKLHILTLSQTKKAVQSKQIDFITTNPGNYIELEAAYSITRLLTLNKLRQGIPSTQFAAVIFARADDTTIKSLYDLRGKSFTAVSQKAFGGFQMAWRELKQHGINPFKDFLPLKFSGFPQDNVVYAVRDKLIDAGTVRTDTLERMARDGLINLGQFKILGQKSSNNFPFLRSTPLYPEWPFAKLAHTSPELAKQVTSSLLNLPGNSIAAHAIQSVGWTIPLDYHTVQELMQELEVGPYQYMGRLTIQSMLIKYWWLFILLFGSIAPPLFAYIKRLQYKANLSLKLAEKEAAWSHALDFLDEPICMVDLDDRLIRANKTYFQAMNTSPGEAIGKKISPYCH